MRVDTVSNPTLIERLADRIFPCRHRHLGEYDPKTRQQKCLDCGMILNVPCQHH